MVTLQLQRGKKQCFGQSKLFESQLADSCQPITHQSGQVIRTDVMKLACYGRHRHSTKNTVKRSTRQDKR